jgi:hypothetical protein
VSRLLRANLLVLALLVAHVLDHSLNQPSRDLPASSGFVGIAGFLLVAASTQLAVRRNRHAAVAAAAAGTLTAIGVIAVHLLPRWWGFVSDPFWDFDANALSWVILIALLGAALLLAAEGFRALGSAPRGVRPGALAS